MDILNARAMGNPSKKGIGTESSWSKKELACAAGRTEGLKLLKPHEAQMIP